MPSPSHAINAQASAGALVILLPVIFVLASNFRCFRFLFLLISQRRLRRAGLLVLWILVFILLFHVMLLVRKYALMCFYNGSFQPGNCQAKPQQGSRRLLIAGNALLRRYCMQTSQCAQSKTASVR
jgi:hypothetical protein